MRTLQFVVPIIALPPLLAFSALQPASAQATNFHDYYSPYSVHFDYWSRCRDVTIDVQRRIADCKSILGSGRGPVNDLEILTQIGDAYLEARQYDQAVDAFEQALAHTRGDPSDLLGAREGRDEAYALAGQFDRALADANDLVKEHPDSADAYNNRCWLRAIAGRDLDAALSDCDEALKRSPKAPGILDSRGLVNFKLNKLADAMADYDAALNQDSKMQTSTYMEGVINLRNRDTTDGNADIAAAKVLEPTIVDRFAAYGVAP